MPTFERHRCALRSPRLRAQAEVPSALRSDTPKQLQADFVVKGVKLHALLPATALAAYATDADLDGTGVAANYGFVGDGAGAAA